MTGSMRKNQTCSIMSASSEYNYNSENFRCVLRLGAKLDRCKRGSASQLNMGSFEYPSNQFQTSLILVILRELESHQKVLAIVKRDVFHLLRAIRGRCLWTPETREIWSNLRKGFCPSNWSSDEKKSLVEFVDFMNGRSQFLERLTSSDDDDIVFHDSIHLPLLSSPKSLCTVLRQVILLDHSRRLFGRCQWISEGCSHWTSVYILMR